MAVPVLPTHWQHGWICFLPDSTEVTLAVVRACKKGNVPLPSEAYDSYTDSLVKLFLPDNRAETLLSLTPLRMTFSDASLFTLLNDEQRRDVLRALLRLDAAALTVTSATDDTKDDTMNSAVHWPEWRARAPPLLQLAVVLLMNGRAPRTPDLVSQEFNKLLDLYDAPRKLLECLPFAPRFLLWHHMEEMRKGRGPLFPVAPLGVAQWYVSFHNHRERRGEGARAAMAAKNDELRYSGSVSLRTKRSLATELKDLPPPDARAAPGAAAVAAAAAPAPPSSGLSLAGIVEKLRAPFRQTLPAPAAAAAAPAAPDKPLAAQKVPLSAQPRAKRRTAEMPPPAALAAAAPPPPKRSLHARQERVMQRIEGTPVPAASQQGWIAAQSPSQQFPPPPPPPPAAASVSPSRKREAPPSPEAKNKDDPAFQYADDKDVDANFPGAANLTDFPRSFSQRKPEFSLTVGSVTAYWASTDKMPEELKDNTEVVMQLLTERARRIFEDRKIPPERRDWMRLIGPKYRESFLRRLDLKEMGVPPFNPKKGTQQEHRDIVITILRQQYHSPREFFPLLKNFDRARDLPAFIEFYNQWGAIFWRDSNRA